MLTFYRKIHLQNTFCTLPEGHAGAPCNSNITLLGKLQKNEFFKLHHLLGHVNGHISH
jgi:hypothetical protein